MAKKYRIKRVNGSDDDTQELLRTFNQIEEAWPKLTDDELEGHNCFWWVAYTGPKFDIPAGFTGLVPSGKFPRAGYLKRSGVLKPHRGNNLQIKFCRIRERVAREVGWNLLVTETTNAMHSANNLIKAGYKLFEPKEPWAFKESLYWRKDLF